MLATSTSADDDDIEKICKKAGIDCFRGSLENVLERFYSAAAEYSPDTVIRLTGDCPLSDPDVIDELVEFYNESGCDYAANCVKAHYPDGLDAEIFRFNSLEDAFNNAELQSHVEHVTPYIRESGKFTTAHFEPEFDYSELRWTVDEPEDFVLVKTIFEALYEENPEFTWKDVLKLVEENPHLKTLNTAYKRNEGYEKSLKTDEEFIDKKN